MRINRTLVSYDIIKLQRRKSMNQPRIQRHYENTMIPFSVEAPFQPMGDQPKAIDSPDQRAAGRPVGAGSIGSDRDRENIYHGQSH